MEGEKKAIEEFIREHMKHSKLFKSGIAASANIWLIKCATCYDDLRIELPDETEASIDKSIELDELAEEICANWLLRCECLDWV